MTGIHVGYVLKVYPRLSETFIVNEILELERQGARVTVFSLHPPREGRFHEKLARVAARVVYLPQRTTHEMLELISRNADRLRPHRDGIFDRLWNTLASGELKELKTLARGLDLALELDRTDVQHLHAHFATSASDCAWIASECSGIPFSFTAHAKDIYLEAYSAEALAARARAARFVVTVCDANREHLESVTPEARIHRIYNGLDLREFEPRARAASDPPEILGVGRLVPKKGFDTLLHALRILQDEGVAFRGTIVGTGLEEANLRDLCGSLGLDARVRFTGALSNEQVRERIGRADVFALPCRVADDGNRDALPTVLLESLALATPVVSTPVTGIPEIVGNDEAGILVPPDEPAALAAALRSLLAAPERARRLGEDGRKRALRLFDGRQTAPELLSLFRQSAATLSDPVPVLHETSLR